MPCFATRKPMLLFPFPGALFKFKAKTPAFVPLFQLPPRSAARTRNGCRPIAAAIWWP